MPDAGSYPLPPRDYQTIGCTASQFEGQLYALSDARCRWVLNANHRLATVAWLTQKLDNDVRHGSHSGPTESLLSLQLYLLLTCADTLGHTFYPPGSLPPVAERFRRFFAELPQHGKQGLIAAFPAWCTSYDELVRLQYVSGTTVYPPTAERIIRHFTALPFDAQLDAVVAFLYARRNEFTHEAEYPQWGYHPGLAVLQRQRLSVPDTAVLGELDHLQLVIVRDRSGQELWHFAYCTSDDPVADVRTAILRGLSTIMGFTPA